MRARDLIEGQPYELRLLGKGVFRGADPRPESIQKRLIFEVAGLDYHVGLIDVIQSWADKEARDAELDIRHHAAAENLNELVGFFGHYGLQAGRRVSPEDPKGVNIKPDPEKGASIVSLSWASLEKILDTIGQAAAEHELAASKS